MSLNRAVLIACLALLPCHATFGTPVTPQKTPPAVDRDGDPLPAGAVARLGMLRWRHDGSTSALAYSPDGRVLAGSCAGKIILWQATTGKRLHQLPLGCVGWLSRHCLDFTADGKVLAVAHRNLSQNGFPDLYAGQVTLWDVTTGKYLRSLAVPKEFGASDLRFSRDGRSVAVGNSFGVYLGDAATGKERWRKHFKNTFVDEFVFSPDGKALAVILRRNPDEVQLWDVATGKVLRAFEHPKNTGITKLTFSADGKSLATVTTDHLLVWEVASGREQARLEAPVRWCIGLGFTAEGKTLVTATDETEVLVWDLEKKVLRSRLGRRLVQGGSRAALSPDGRTFAVGTNYSQVHLWNIATGKELHTDVIGHDSAVRCLTFSPDGRLLASGGDRWQVRLWDTRTWGLVRSLDGNAQSLSFSPDGKRLAGAPFVPTNFIYSGSNVKNKPLAIWDVASGKTITTVPEQAGQVCWGAFTAGGKRLVYFDARLVIWDVAGKRPVVQSEVLAGESVWGANTGLIGKPLLSPDGKTALVAIRNDQNRRLITTDLYAIDLESGQHQRVLSTDQGSAVALSADGKTLASGDWRIQLWDLTKQKPVFGLPEDFGRDKRRVSVLAFSPDGRWLASAAGSPLRLGDVPDPARIRIWDVKTGKEVASFVGDEGFVSTLTFSPDGNRLLSGMHNGTVLVWDCTQIAARRP